MEKKVIRVGSVGVGALGRRARARYCQESRFDLGGHLRH